jgi:DNA polymerase
MRTYDIINAGPNNRFMANGRIVSNSGGGGGGGVGIQPQNLVKPSKALENHMDRALELLKAADYETIKKEFEYPLDVAAAAIRPILHAAPGHTFYIADLNAIESRVAGWVAGDETMMNIFKPTEQYPDGLDPYLAFAVQLDGHRTYEEMWHEWKIEKKKKYRNEAKAPVLGCIYGLSAGAIEKDAGGNLIKTGLLGYAAAMGIDLDQELATKAVEVFRRTYSDIVNFWYDLHRAFSNVVENDAVVELGQLRLDKKGNVLRVILPSGRALHYMNPTSVWEDATSKKGNSYRKNVLGYDGLNQETHSWGWVETRGAKVFENAVQAIARDVIANGIRLSEERGFFPVLHVHDEVAGDVPIDSPLTVKDLEDCLSTPLDWAPGLVLRAEGFSSDFYKKE